MIKIKPKLKRLLKKTDQLLSSKYFLPLFLVVFAMLIYLAFSGKPILEDIYFFTENGEMLIYGLKDKALSYNMPLTSLIIAFFRYHLNVPISLSLNLFSQLMVFFSCLLAWNTGLILGGKRAGFFSLLFAAFLTLNSKNIEFEQILYTFSVMLALYAIILKNKYYNFKTALLSGLAIGFTCLIRSPLFLLPLLIVFIDYFKHSRNLRKYIFNSMVFLLAAYILLLPWVRVNHFLFNKFIPFEAERSTCNIITSVRGATFTMEGDSRKLAGINNDESIYKWAARELLKNPMSFLNAVPRRLLQVFYIYPFLILMALFALIKRKDEEITLISIVAGYFIFIHCLLSIEERYFYPLKYILSIPAALFITSFFKHSKDDKFNHFKITKIIFIFASILIFATEVLLIAYPFRARILSNSLNNDEYGGRWLLKKKGESLLNNNKTEKGIEFMSLAYKKAPKQELELSYILKTLKAKKHSKLENPPDSLIFYQEMRLIKMLKELHMDELEAAKKDFVFMTMEENRFKVYLRNPISKVDFKIFKEIKKTNQISWQKNINKVLYWWPVGERLKIILNFNKIISQDINAKKGVFLLLCQMNEYEKALAMITESIKDMPNISDFYNDRGVLLKSLNKHRRAEKDFENALKLTPSNYEVLFNLADIKITLNKSSEARLLLKKLLKSDPELKWMNKIKNQNFWELNWKNSIKFYLKEILKYSKTFRVKCFPEPFDSIAKALDNDKSAIDFFHVSMGYIDSPELSKIIHLYESIGNNKKFKINAQKLFNSHPGNPAYAVIYLACVEQKNLLKENERLLKNPGYIFTAMKYFSNKDKGKSIAFLPLISRRSLNDKNFLRLAIVYQSMGEYEKALKIFNKLILKNPHNASLYNDRGVLFRFLNENTKAEKDFENGIKLAPSNYEVLFNLASVKSVLGKKTDAKALFAEIIKSAPKSKWADISHMEIKNLH